MPGVVWKKARCGWSGEYSGFNGQSIGGCIFFRLPVLQFMGIPKYDDQPAFVQVYTDEQIPMHSPEFPRAGSVDNRSGNVVLRCRAFVGAQTQAQGDQAQNRSGNGYDYGR